MIAVDDHPLTVRAIANLLRDQPDMHLIEATSSAEEAVQLALRERPDVVVVDLRLRGGVDKGTDLAKVLAALVPETRILIYSAHITEVGLRQLRSARIAGYIPKTAQPRHLVDAIRAAGSGFMLGVLEGGTNDRDPKNRTAAGLSDRELSVVQLLAEGFENDELAERLALSASSVRLCLTSLFVKLGVRNRTEAVVKAHRLGLISID